ncbi:hypothetical protein [Conexibacter sp. DBS9H8]|uniref:hypothetical protein n=1 Tax=Conexibacter sp. DBS9H8 TaxID=2937801 RepID=UPI00200E03D6|nr:hypothetical protein [Conexibacter sp. DBS9H8]
MATSDTYPSRQRSRPRADYRSRSRVRARRRSLFGGGPAGNEQLTAVTGVILLVLFAFIGITILRIGQMLWLHLFVGVLLVGPVGLKLATTGYRFTRYYTGSAVYRRKGPPHPMLRILGPFVILTTLGVLFSGLLLLLVGPTSSNLLRLFHKATFILWLGAMGLHVLGHLAELPDAVRAVSHEQRRRDDLPGTRGRVIALIVAMVAGLILALIFLPDVNVWSHTGLYPAGYAAHLGH